MSLRGCSDTSPDASDNEALASEKMGHRFPLELFLRVPLADSRVLHVMADATGPPGVAAQTQALETAP